MNSIKISRILHAGYILESDNCKIVFDPIFENPFSQNCYAYPQVEFDLEQIKALKFDAVFISHYHDDHLSLESLNHIARSTPIYLYSRHQVFFSLLAELGFTQVQAIEIDQPISIGPFFVTARQAVAADVDSIFQISCEGINILNLVDAWISPDTLEKLPQSIDLVMWPFQIMREAEVLSPNRFSNSELSFPSEWIQQLKYLKPKNLIASSCQFIHEDWSWLKHSFFQNSYSFFFSEVKKINLQINSFRLNPGESILLSNSGVAPAERLPWITPVGEQNVDYQYIQDFKAPATSQIAKNFPELSTQQKNQVLQFCQNEILQRFKNIGGSNDNYFNVRRNWQLSLWACSGESINIYYSLDGDEISVLSKLTEQIAWLTEIPIFKLYRAIFCGETLSSIYIRVNDCQFSPQIEKNLKDAEILEDPLIRCLYAQEIAGYHKAQLAILNQEPGN